MNCRQFEAASNPTLKVNGLYVSVARCPNKQWKLTDCNAVIDSEIDQCVLTQLKDEGRNYGGVIKGQTCKAIGTTTGIKAKATCCKID